MNEAVQERCTRKRISLHETHAPSYSDLKVKLVDLQQQTDDSIVEYLERVAKLVTKFPTEEFDMYRYGYRARDKRPMLTIFEVWGSAAMYLCTLT